MIKKNFLTNEDLKKLEDELNEVIVEYENIGAIEKGFKITVEEGIYIDLLKNNKSVLFDKRLSLGDHLKHYNYILRLIEEGILEEEIKINTNRKITFPFNI